MDKQPFVRYTLEEDTDKNSRVFTVRLNQEEIKEFEESARILEQEKISTAIKQLAKLGLVVLHDQKTRYVLDTVFINKRRNKRIGIESAQPDFIQK